MQEGVLLAMIRLAEQRIKELEYRVQLLEQKAGRAENTINQVRSGGAS